MKHRPSDHLVSLILSAQMTGSTVPSVSSARETSGDSWQRSTSVPVLQQAQLERRGHAGYKVVIKEKWGADSGPCHEIGAGGTMDWSSYTCLWPSQAFS